ncbi:MAG: hypothetical protein ACK5LO_14120 [Leucobacter sp.]
MTSLDCGLPLTGGRGLVHGGVEQDVEWFSVFRVDAVVVGDVQALEERLVGDPA